MPPAEFEPAAPASDQPQVFALKPLGRWDRQSGRQVPEFWRNVLRALVYKSSKFSLWK